MSKIEVRCPKCKHLVGKVVLGVAQIEFYCRHCKQTVGWPTMTAEIVYEEKPLPPRPPQPVIPPPVVSTPSTVDDGKVAATKLTVNGKTAADVIAEIKKAQESPDA